MGLFHDVEARILGLKNCSLAWGDYDNDGNLDLVVTGKTGVNQVISKVYRNNGGGSFADAGVGLAGVYGTSAWGDYDGDGDLDLIITGGTGSWEDLSPVTILYRNNATTPNTAPLAPSGLSATITNTETTFGWNAATDAQTPPKGLSYNLRVGTAPGRDDVFTAMADITSGVRRLPKLGNVQQRLSWTIKGLTGGPYYWSVQAIDSTYAGSAWAAEQNTTFPTGNGIGIQEVKNTSDTQPVILKSGTFGVTAVFDGSFYVEDISRACGIRVDGPASGALLNRLVSITGNAMTDPENGEKYIKADKVLAGLEQVTDPLGMVNSRIGGGSFGLQQGMSGMSGLNNTGLLVKAWGIAAQQTDSTFTLNDGSGPLQAAEWSGLQPKLAVHIRRRHKFLPQDPRRLEANRSY